jgi:hypothetical protein
MTPDIADLLLAAYDCGYCHAAGIAIESPVSPYLRHLLTTVAMRHRTEVLALRAWADPPLSRQMPPWLRALAAEADALACETAPLGSGKAFERLSGEATER